MPQNLVSLDLSADQIAAMDQAIATLETLTKPFITLSADDKSGLVKMGDKSVAFCQQTALVLAQNKDALPAGFDWPRPDRRREFLRARVGEAGQVELFPNQGPGVLSSTVWAAGLVDNPAGHAITQGEPVSFIPYSELLS